MLCFARMVWLLCGCCAVATVQGPLISRYTSNYFEINETFRLLNEGDMSIELKERYKNVTLLLGNTGSGKTTLAQWIFGDNDQLIAKETTQGTDEYIIDDHNKRIGNSTIQSKTIFPELLIDTKTNTAYYDCPGFSDTRSSSIDIATTYLTKKVADHVENIKILFVVGYPAVRKGVDRQDFMKLMRHSTDFIKDVDKFQNSIAIVVTKVDNTVRHIGKGLYSLVPDDKIIEAIADFFLEVKQSFMKFLSDANILHEEKKFYENAIKFVNIFSIKNGKNYTRIGIFRRPTEPGPLSNITSMQEGKEHIERILHKNLNFTQKCDEDFGYTVSEKSKNGIGDLAEKINTDVCSSVTDVANELKKYYSSLVEQISSRIEYFSKSPNVDVRQAEAQMFTDKLAQGFDVLTNLAAGVRNLTSIEELASKINDSISVLNIDVPRNVTSDILIRGKYFNFLQVVSDKRLNTRPLEWAKQFQHIVMYLSDSNLYIQNNVNGTAEKVINKVNSDINSISEEIKKYYQSKMHSLEIHKLRDELNKGYNLMLHLTTEIKHLSTAQELSKKIRDYISNLDIDTPKISSRTFNIYNFGKYLKFLKTISNEALSTWSPSWVTPFNEMGKYLSESEGWYRFLNDLYAKLLRYTEQKHYNSIVNTIIYEENFKEFLSNTQSLHVTEYNTVKNIKVAGFRLQELNKVLDLTLRRSIQFCQSDKLVVKGDNIKFSDFVDTDGSLMISCGNGTKSVDIFALNTLFIDGDLKEIGKKLSVTAIAPKWEVIGMRKIVLSGSDGESHDSPKANNSRQNGDNGVDGKPGLPGGASGSFFGIGIEVFNGNMLDIIANGGNGGPGQDGEDGTKGLDGATPVNSTNFYNDYVDCNEYVCNDVIKAPSNSYCVLSSKNEGRCKYHFLYYVSRWDCIKFTIYGYGGESGSRGGNGGKEGMGGKAGDIRIITLGSGSRISISNDAGNIGMPGKGGKGGHGGNNGYGIRMSCEKKIVLSNISSRKRFNFEGFTNHRGYAASGKNGTDGANHLYRKDPSPAAVISNPAIIINGYKSYLRENIADKFRKHSLINFLSKLESNDAIKDTYDILGFVDELRGLEEQFYVLRNNKAELVSFYRSLLDRISKYAQNPKNNEKSNENKKALLYLYTASLSKIYDLKTDTDSTLIIDVEGYLEVVKSNIMTLKTLQEKSNKVIIINECKKQYKNNIDKKIEESRSFIEKEITPEIDRIHMHIGDKIDLLINEIIALQKDYKKSRDEFREKRTKLENALVMMGLFSCIEIATLAISFLGSPWAVSGLITGARASIIESFVLDDHTSQKDPLTLSVSLTDDFKLMDDRIKMIKDKKVAEFNKELGVKSDNNDTDSKVAGIVKNLADIYNKYKYDKARLEVISDTLKQAENKIQDIKQYENEIYDTIAPMLQNAEEDLKEIRNKLNKKSQVTLEVTRWQVQTSLKDMKSRIQKLIKGFKLENDLARYIEKLEEAITTLINIYDRIQNYQEQQNLADYIAAVSSSDTTDTWSDTPGNLEILIRFNLILKQYETSINALKQWVFPLAHHYLNEITLPLDLQMNITNIEDSASKAVRQIDHVKSKVGEYKKSIWKHDQYLSHGWFGSYHVSTNPFFIWKNNEHKDAISKLLSGEEIVVKADIRSSAPDKNAIKFNLIEINLKSTNATTQREVDEKLKTFKVSATHLGNSYYRYNEKFYVITSESQNIQYYYEKGNDGLPIHRNKVYEKIKDGDLILSPYAMWTFQIINVTNRTSFDTLKMYTDEVDLELVGYGSYVSKEDGASSLNIGDYYRSDDTIIDNDINDIYTANTDQKNDE